MVGKLSLQKVATLAIIQEISDSHLERPGDMDQNVESHGLSGRVDSTVINIKRLPIE